ncbi:hypothetical protein [Pontibacter anaerobius]|uniref:Lipoprotein n=1 Tax=Pontibacter anaerobius TaxID=2993940 RepID=A0ABT3RF86_9BACT|nr:hypothetical protein [Pontibacter anaerobius]MCX2740435.1 hypothetical protein [Pontibacter anaerobius]
MTTERLTGLLMLLALPGCSLKMPAYTSSGKQVLMEQKHVSLSILLIPHVADRPRQT